jgi:hypothetical protein
LKKERKKRLFHHEHRRKGPTLKTHNKASRLRYTSNGWLQLLEARKHPLTPLPEEFVMNSRLESNVPRGVPYEQRSLR